MLHSVSDSSHCDDRVMVDFFISYTAVDGAWAGWIAFVLEEHEYSVIVQAWDFRPGSNFVVEMHKAASQAERTIAVLSPDYLKSAFGESEWSAAFARDPKGVEGRLVPVIVRPCEPSGLLRSIIHIDLSNAGEAEARSLLIEGIDRGRAKPSKRPTFPGRPTHAPVSFPGRSEAEDGRSNSADELPELRRPPTDLEKRQFTKLAFELTQARFRAALVELSRRNSLLTYEIEGEASSKFTVDAFYAGKSIVNCSVWKGSLSSPDGISYAEGSHARFNSAANEILTISSDPTSICFSALVGDSFAKINPELNLKRLSADGVAKYLWSKFANALETSVRRQ
jgi:hypothetical protein